MKRKLLVLSMLVATNVYASHTQVTAQRAVANAAYGSPSVAVTATGYTTYTLSNNSAVTVNYKIDSYLCINNGSCTHYKYSIDVGPWITKSGTINMATTGPKLQKGTWEDEATIEITGAESAYAHGTNSVIIQ